MAGRIRFQWFERRRDGTIVLHLFPEEAATLALLADELTALLQEPQRAATAYRRLFPPAYLDPDEAAAEQVYDAFVHSHLLTARLEQLARLRGFLHEVMAGRVERRSGQHALVLDDDARELLLGVLNDLRLAFGSVLNVTDHDFEDAEPASPADGSPGDEADPGAAALGASRALYDALTALQGELVELLLYDLPESGTD